MGSSSSVSKIQQTASALQENSLGNEVVEKKSAEPEEFEKRIVRLANSFRNPHPAHNYGTPTVADAAFLGPAHEWWQQGSRWQSTPRSLELKHPPEKWHRPRDYLADYDFSMRKNSYSCSRTPRTDLSTELPYPLPMPDFKPAVFGQDQSWKSYRDLADSGLPIKRVPVGRLPSKSRPRKGGKIAPADVKLAPEACECTSTALMKTASAPVVMQAPQQDACSDTREDWAKFIQQGKAVPLTALPFLAKTPAEEVQRTNKHVHHSDPSSSQPRRRSLLAESFFSQATKIGNSIRSRTPGSTDAFDTNGKHVKPSSELAQAPNRQEPPKQVADGVSQKLGKPRELPEPPLETQPIPYDYSKKIIDRGLRGFSVPLQDTRPVALPQKISWDDYQEEWVESRLSRRRREAALARNRHVECVSRLAYTPKLSAQAKKTLHKAFEAGEFRPAPREPNLFTHRR